MKMFKRFAAALLAGVMVLAMLTACGGGAGGNSSNEIESKVLKYLNTVNGTSYSNNADLQSKVRAVLAKTDDTGVIKAEDVPYVQNDESGTTYMQCVSDLNVNETENTVSFVMYVFDPNKMDGMLTPVTKAELKDVKPLEVNDEFKAKLDDVLENVTPGTPSGKLSTMKDVGVATYTASNGKTYIALPSSVKVRFVVNKVLLPRGALAPRGFFAPFGRGAVSCCDPSL